MTRVNLSGGKGMNLVELSITVAIISVCLVIGLRVFLISSKSISAWLDIYSAAGIIKERYYSFKELYYSKGQVAPYEKSSEAILMGRKYRVTETVGVSVCPGDPAGGAGASPDNATSGETEVKVSGLFGDNTPGSSQEEGAFASGEDPRGAEGVAEGALSFSTVDLLINVTSPSRSDRTFAFKTFLAAEKTFND